MFTKQLSILVSVLLLSFLGNAQTDLPKTTPLEIGTITDPEYNNDTSKGTALNIPSIIDPKPNINLRDSLTRVPIKMLPDNEMLQAGHNLKLDPKVKRNYVEDGSKEYFPDFYLGDIRIKSDSISIVYKDFGLVDNDQLQIIINDSIVKPRIFLTGEFRGIKVKLSEGFNQIDFKALSTGDIAPNTAQFRIYNNNDGLEYFERWALSTGSKATLIITKE